VIFWGIVSLVLIYSAYVSEVYRAGIESIHPSQEAAPARSASAARRRCDA
jgi:ABC-type amino acid transport system, permease component